jgi:uncharacterized membrane protein
MKIAGHESPDVKQNQQKAAVTAMDVNADHQSIVVNASAADVYSRYLKFEELPRFIPSVTKVEKISDTCFSCTSTTNGEEVTSNVDIIMRVPERRVAWHANSKSFPLGVTSFDPLPGGATRVTVKVRSIIEPVLLTRALRDCLRNFKQHVERSVSRKQK